jgi:hypothetical protein
MMAKVIQLVIEQGTEEIPSTLYALTDDGKIWKVDEPEGLLATAEDGSVARWVSVPPPPVNFGMGRVRE